MDDLAGCAAILAALERFAGEGPATDMYGVFTRAEEGGLFGARLMAEAETLPKDTVIVSVESSAVIPGVKQGAGPVIRTGDAMTTFDSEAEGVLTAAVASIPGTEAGVQGAAATDVGGSVRGNGVFLGGIRGYGRGVSSRELSQRDYVDSRP